MSALYEREQDVSSNPSEILDERSKNRMRVESDTVYQTKKMPNRKLMSRTAKFTLKDIEKEVALERTKLAIKVKHNYIHNHRYIPHAIYSKLKTIRKCEKCGKEFKPYERGQIHHKVAVRDEGKNNNIKNLMVVCTFCHRDLDKKQRELHG